MFRRILLALGYVRLVDHGLAIDDDGIARPVGEKLPIFSFMVPVHDIGELEIELEIELLSAEEAQAADVVELKPKFLNCDTLLSASPSFRPPPSTSPQRR